MRKPKAVNPCRGSAASLQVARVHGNAGPSAYFPFPGPIGSLLSHLGLTPGQKAEEDHHRSHIHMEVISTIKDQVASHKESVESFKNRLEDMIHHVESESIPLMEGGIVKIMPIFNNFGDLESPENVHHKQAVQHPKFRTGHWDPDHERKLRIAEWDAMAGKDGIKAVHHSHHGHHHAAYPHRKGRSFGCRLNHALKSLKPAESLSLAFVLGAGIGSLLHLFFMVLLLTIRRLRGGSCAERKAARRERRAAKAERRAARKAAKAAGKKGGVRLESGDEDEVLPAYGEEEHERLVEKA
ncbi:hypothetical protein BD324DRAFT_633930 [Kockovaella imperatae]|uniref:Uncharacterized protein n=1 Tax=Kockovaella imperatae TaxID=4999 RepID=A0A1Y1UDG2_9TREE|nr:hypothetical protein BD324DRAFT_633930 [Kockovaella imperatae]ORX35115.1 hypothetical protein BD324DRAFT_633930 [Kockovaella imperatae]